MKQINNGQTAVRIRHESDKESVDTPQSSSTENFFYSIIPTPMKKKKKWKEVCDLYNITICGPQKPVGNRHVKIVFRKNCVHFFLRWIFLRSPSSRIQWNKTDLCLPDALMNWYSDKLNRKYRTSLFVSKIVVRYNAFFIWSKFHKIWLSKLESCNTI